MIPETKTVLEILERLARTSDPYTKIEIIQGGSAMYFGLKRLSFKLFPARAEDKPDPSS